MDPYGRTRKLVFVAVVVALVGSGLALGVLTSERVGSAIGTALPSTSTSTQDGPVSSPATQISTPAAESSTSNAVQAAAVVALANEGLVDIVVQVDNGIATLTGRSGEREKALVEVTVLSVPGVERVVNNIRLTQESPTQVPVPSPTPGPTRYRPNVLGYLAVRDEPSRSGFELGEAPADVTLTIEGDPIRAEGLEWVQVRTDRGDEGWVAAMYLIEAELDPPSDIRYQTTIRDALPLLYAPAGETQPASLGSWDRVIRLGPPITFEGTTWVPVGSTRPGYESERGWVEERRLEVAWYQPRSRSLSILNSPAGQPIGSIPLGERFNLFGFSEVVGGDHYIRARTSDGEEGWVAAFNADPVG